MRPSTRCPSAPHRTEHGSTTLPKRLWVASCAAFALSSRHAPLRSACAIGYSDAPYLRAEPHPTSHARRRLDPSHPSEYPGTLRATSPPERRPRLHASMLRVQMGARLPLLMLPPHHAPPRRALAVALVARERMSRDLIAFGAFGINA
ncbi:hypothetical protein DFH09DRAFT_1363865 [Mycena vulgaris]|nr:hypothetical protein DFH09DRAFT_1363865 [Mycena vulgaris]